MKHYILFVTMAALLLCSSSMLFGQLLLEETFNTPTTDITTYGTWTLIAQGQIGSSTAPPYIVVKDGSALFYSGYFESGSGNSAYLGGGGQDANVAILPITTTGSYYLAFLLKVDSASIDGDYFWAMRYATSNHNRWRGWIRKDTSGGSGNTFNLGIGKGSTAGLYSARKLTYDSTYLVVAKYNFNTTSTNDALLTLWINPDISTFGSASEDPNPVIRDTVADNGTADFATAPNRFALIMNDPVKAPYLYVGGVRFASNWATAVPSPPYYFNGTGDIALVTSWGINTDGSGLHPVNFSGGGAQYFLKNISSLRLLKTWSVTGIGSRVIIGSGVNCIVQKAKGWLNAQAVDVATGGMLTLQEGYKWAPFGTISGTVAFDTAVGIILDKSYTFPASNGYFDVKNGDLNINNAAYILTVQGRMRFNTNKVKGIGTFKLDSAGTLAICSPEGLSASAATGEVQTSTRLFSTFGNYSFQGSTDQMTGTGIPDTVGGLEVRMAGKSNITSLSKKIVDTTGTLGLTRGKFRLGAYDIVFSSPGGQSDSSYVITDSTGALVRVVYPGSTSVKTLPIGSMTEYRKAAVTFTGGSANKLFLRAQYTSGDPGSAGYPAGVVKHNTLGYWTITTTASPGTPYRLDLDARGIGFDTTKLAILWRPNSSTSWAFASSVNSYLYSNGLLTAMGIDSTTFGQFTIVECASTLQSGDRYKAEIFNFGLQSDIQFGSSPTPNSKTLTMDVYTPAADTVTNRPLVIFIHGGGFSSGDKVSNYGTLICTGLARRGYVVASINYRTSSSSSVATSDSAHFEAMMKALQDSKAAVRYFRKNGSKYSIDTSQIFVTGSSAGSITALHLAYLDSAEVPYNVWPNINNAFEGSSGSAGYSSRVQGVISAWGAIGDTAWMKAGDPPVYFVHGTSDSTVYFDGNPSRPADGPFKYGSKWMYQQAQNIKLKTAFRPFYGTGHTLDNNTAKQDSAYREFSTWLFTLLKPGTGGLSGVDELKALVPSEFALYQNYPNPFNPATTIMYDLPKDTKVSLIVYNVLGQEVKRLADFVQPAGSYKVIFDASRYASGVYFYRLVTADQTAIRKMMMLK